ncbi:MAG TPA: hypothetical protein VHB79_25145 [Polyangiaceae bacterium]|nr:hypothetical protein [Polyangiaceae bacterium]
MLDGAVLVPEVDLEMVNLLAVALKAEGSGLDDAGVDRTYRDLVHLLTVDAVKRVLAHRCTALLEAQGLEPRVAGHGEAGLLVQLAFKAVEFRADAGELVVAPG